MKTPPHTKVEWGSTEDQVAIGTYMTAAWESALVVSNGSKAHALYYLQVALLEAARRHTLMYDEPLTESEYILGLGLVTQQILDRANATRRTKRVRWRAFRQIIRDARRIDKTTMSQLP